MATPLLKVSTGSILRTLLLLLLLTPVWLWLAWLLTEKRVLVLAIIDKTVLTTKGQEHISLNWVLNQEKFSKKNAELYNREKDYFGFFPLDNNKYQLKGLERFSNDRLQQLSQDVDIAYLTDTYGIYNNEWYHEGDDKARSGIVYGGMSRQDLYFIQQMRAKHKLIITEFNCLASPTDSAVRAGFEKTFGISWTKWIGRYFDSFDTSRNKELPRWLIDLYKKQHRGQWPFTKSGIAFVNSDDRILILETGTHLYQPLPQIISGRLAQQHYGLPAAMHYSFWFDVIIPDKRLNQMISEFKIDVNDAGKYEMTKYGLSTVFPAITAHVNSDYRFFYFSADFADNPIRLTSSYFRGMSHFKSFLYNRRDPLDRNGFFWNVYQPLVTTILNDYYATGLHH